MAANIQSSNSQRIGLLLRPDHAHHREIALGAVEYQRANSHIQIVGDSFHPLVSWDHLKDFDGDAIVAIANSQQELQQLEESNIPFVLAGARFIDSRFPVVASNNLLVGELAANHLHSCGLKNFMFVGSLNWDDERLRYQGFQEQLKVLGAACAFGECAEIDFPFSDEVNSSKESVSRLVELIQNESKPLGLFCPNSFIARTALFAATRIGLKVPDDIAIIAVNNDPLLCETTNPPLSTIIQPSRQIGFHAVAILNECLQGEKARHLMLPPKRISVRRSSDVLMVGNEIVEKALRFIRDHCRFQIEISEIAEHVGVSRRTLEMRFRETLQSSPHQELLRTRLDLAKSLLLDSEIPITQIAMSTGFGSSQVFSTTFKKQTGQTPTQFRIQEHTA